MPPHGELKDIDRGWRETIQKMAAAAQKPGAHVTVGWPATAGQHAGSSMSVAEIAAQHEFGTARIPQRSMLRATVEIYEHKYTEALRKIGIGITAGRIDLKGGLDLLGVMIKGDVQKRIAAGIMPPNAPSTIARKGSSTPLIDTGQMRNAIEHEVRGA
jgi:hypothetical protein